MTDTEHTTFSLNEEEQ